MLLPKQTKQIIIGAVSFCMLGIVGCSDEAVQPNPNLIPKPQSMQFQKGFFKTDSAALFAENSDKVKYQIVDDLASQGSEAYRLTVDSKGVNIEAASDAGLFYAQQTLLQLLQPEGLPYVTISDSPRFPYRGLHLDVSRHFFPKEEVMKIIDVMAFYKMNRLHFHLTDAGGWRIEIDKYPRLTSHGSARTESDWRKWWDGKDRKYVPEGTEGSYGGYYTKQDIRDIVAYAYKKHIVVLPEIEFPGHSEEVFAAYPELCCKGKPYTGGDFCIGNEKTYTFMEDVLTEIMELFPSEYIHIGGDEAGKGNWKTCPKCQALMKKEGIQDNLPDRNDFGGQTRNQPTQEQVDQYEYIVGDYGYSIFSNEAKDGGYDDENPYVNRDPRFYRDIIYAGAKFQSITYSPQVGGEDEINHSTLRDGKDTRTGYALRKFVYEDYDKEGSVTTMFFPLIRLPEMMLIYAEALNETDNSEAGQKVYDLLNQIRNRSFMKKVPEAVKDNKELRREYIQRERRVELFFENNRYFNLRYKGIPTSSEELLKEGRYLSLSSDGDERAQKWVENGNGEYPQTQHYVHGMIPVSDPNGKVTIGSGKYKMKRIEGKQMVRQFTYRNYFFPINSNEIAKTPSLKQNPGW